MVFLRSWFHKAPVAWKNKTKYKNSAIIFWGISLSNLSNLCWLSLLWEYQLWPMTLVMNEVLSFQSYRRHVSGTYPAVSDLSMCMHICVGTMALICLTVHLKLCQKKTWVQRKRIGFVLLFCPTCLASVLPVTITPMSSILWIPWAKSPFTEMRRSCRAANSLNSYNSFVLSKQTSAQFILLVQSSTS